MKILFILSALFSTTLYLYLHKKTHIDLKFLYKDNIIVILVSTISAFLISYNIDLWFPFLGYIAVPLLVIGFAFTFTLIRFFRTPVRQVTCLENEIVSPADGNIIYIKKIEKGEVPLSVKKGVIASLIEFTQTNLLKTPCWIIGINMTPFDVHKNCSPIDGIIVFNTHINGEFLSLKDPIAVSRNERNSVIIKNDHIQIGVVQTASKLVRRIDSYIKVGEPIKKGEWFGMIRFGSQVDIILPVYCQIHVNIGQQIYAAKTTIASYENPH